MTQHAPPAPDATRHITTAFGAVDVPDSHVLHFADGLRGLASYKAWVLLSGEAPNTLWLQSVDEPALALLLVDPFATFPGFALDVPDDVVEALGATQPDDVLVMAPVTLGRPGEPTTANLRGPVLINWHTHRGLQLVVDGGPWSVREAFVPANAPR